MIDPPSSGPAYTLNPPSNNWWNQPDRFITFVDLAKAIIAQACVENHRTPDFNILTLQDYLNLTISILDQHRIPPHMLCNPKKWEKFKMAPQIFAKSLALLTNSSHLNLRVHNNANLSFLLANLEMMLKRGQT